MGNIDNIDVVLEDDILLTTMNLENNNKDKNSLADVETGQQLVFENNRDDNSTSTTKLQEDITSIDLMNSVIHVL